MIVWNKLTIVCVPFSLVTYATTILAEHGSSKKLGLPSTPIAPTDMVYILDA